MNVLIRLAAGLLLGMALARIAPAADTYPSQAIRIVVPGGAGGVLDIHARKVAENLGRSLGQTVIVENKPGANGFIAAAAVLNSKPDGYTLFLGANAHLTTHPSLFTKMPYDPVKDFEPITLAAGGYPVLMVTPKVPVKSLMEFVSYAKANPGKLTYGSPAIGSPHHLAMELLSQQAGISLVHVPYKNDAEIMTDLVSGQIDVLVEFFTRAKPFIESGKVRALAIMGPKRKLAIPDVPTAEEAGIAGVEVRGWHGYLAPRGTPAAIVQLLNREMTAAIRSKTYAEFLDSVSAEMMAGSAQEFAELIRKDTVQWSKVIKQAGIRLE